MVLCSFYRSMLINKVSKNNNCNIVLWLASMAVKGFIVERVPPNKSKGLRFDLDPFCVLSFNFFKHTQWSGNWIYGKYECDGLLVFLRGLAICQELSPSIRRLYWKLLYFTMSVLAQQRLSSLCWRRSNDGYINRETGQQRETDREKDSSQRGSCRPWGPVALFTSVLLRYITASCCRIDAH